MSSVAPTCRYVHVAGRAVHYRHAGRGAPVVLLHASPRSSAAMLPLMRAAPAGQAMYAIDLPGFGRSMPLAPRADGAPHAIDAFAEALAETLSALGLPRVRLYGTHTGGAVATAFAVLHPDRVERLVVDGLSVFDATQTATLGDYLPEFRANADGTQMAWAWNRMRDQALFFPWHARRTDARLCRPLPPADALQAATLDLLVASDYRDVYGASFRSDGRAWTARLNVPTRIGARGDDVLRSHLDRLGEPPACVTIAPFADDAAAWAAEVWAALGDGGPDVAPNPVDAPWGASTPMDRHDGPPGARLHWRGCAAGAGRPLVALHDSPGSARGLDGRLAPLVGRRPVFACDLPGHAESEPLPHARADALLDALDDALARTGLADAELCGDGVGAWLADSLVARRPGRTTRARVGARGPTPPPGHAAARADGGHLAEAWFDARDAVILGRWWTRDPRIVHDFGAAPDWQAIQRDAVERLFEAPQAAALRREVAELTSPSASRTPTRRRSRSAGRTP